MLDLWTNLDCQPLHFFNGPFLELSWFSNKDAAEKLSQLSQSTLLLKHFIKKTHRFNGLMYEYACVYIHIYANVCTLKEEDRVKETKCEKKTRDRDHIWNGSRPSCTLFQ